MDKKMDEVNMSPFIFSFFCWGGGGGGGGYFKKFFF